MSERASLAVRGSDSLALRRRKRRQRGLFALGLFILIGLGVLLYGLWRPTFRISHIEVYGGDDTVTTIAEHDMQGSYLAVIPRNSIFFVPTAQIRADILATHLETAAVSIFTDGFTGLSIKLDDRTPVGRWCGEPIASSSPQDRPLKEVVPTADRRCYLFDPSGFLYATARTAFLTEDASASPFVAESGVAQALTPFVLFDSLAPGTQSLLGATLNDATRLPAIFDFARRLKSLGPSVDTVVIRNTEVDLFLTSTTVPAPRITYLLGDEQNALTALVSGKGELNLSDPTLQYVDLRFSGKIYFKRNSP